MDSCEDQLGVGFSLVWVLVLKLFVTCKALLSNGFVVEFDFTIFSSIIGFTLCFLIASIFCT